MKALIHREASELVSASQVPFLVSVSAFETGGFKSPVCCNNRNLFGMKLPSKRPTVAVKELNGYAYYDTFQDSIFDFYLWWQYVNFPKCHSLWEFVHEMKRRNYFEADLDKYYDGCKYWFEKLYK